MQNVLSELVLEKRKEKGLTQEELASRCRLDTRTIQRIEKGEVKPYFSTLKILSEILDYDLISDINQKPWEFTQEEIEQYRKKFKRRKIIRITILIFMLFLLLAVAATFPSFRLFGMSKLTWAPFFYLLMFGLIIAIALIWRCPACNAELANPFSTKFCPKCGFKFYQK